MCGVIMALYKHITMLGYIISAVIGFLWMSGMGLLFAVVLYPLTILLRGTGLALVSRALNKRFFILVSIVVLIGGVLLYTIGLNILPLPGVNKDFDVPKHRLLAVIWIIYSLAELSSYVSLRKYAQVFLGALSSIVGIGIIAVFLQAPIATPQEFLPFALYAAPFLILSALCAAIGFTKLQPSE